MPVTAWLMMVLFLGGTWGIFFYLLWRQARTPLEEDTES